MSSPLQAIKKTVNEPFVFEQFAPMVTWTVVHNLGNKPQITVVDDNDEVVIASEVYQDFNTVLIMFNTPSTGRAYLR